MEIPLGFARNLATNKVCSLKKALYGLNNRREAWFGIFTKVTLAMGYKQSQGGHTLFIKHLDSGGVKKVTWATNLEQIMGDPKHPLVLSGQGQPSGQVDSYCQVSHVPKNFLLQEEFDSQVPETEISNHDPSPMPCSKPMTGEESGDDIGNSEPHYLNLERFFCSVGGSFEDDFPISQSSRTGA